ncbi:MAG: FkbM family methyltransferase [Eubacteriales bacterium]
MQERMTEALPAPDTVRDLWQSLREAEAPLVVYGMGDGADKLTARLSQLNLSVADYFASDSFVRGQSFHGKPLRTFRQIKETYSRPIILLGFATKQPDVMQAIWNMAQSDTLFIPDLPVCGETYFDAAFYAANFERLYRVYHLLADDKSKRVFETAIAAKLYGRVPDLFAHTDTPENVTAPLHPHRYRTTVDAGAYNGDTVRTLLVQNPAIRRIHALEPDAGNFAKLRAYAQTVPHTEIVCHRAAAWDSVGSAPFGRAGNRGAALFGRTHASRPDSVPLVTIDRLCAGERVDFIKYDVEGAEVRALQGSAQTIAASRPELLLSLYHRSEDLFELPLLVAQLCPDYRLYLRRPPCLPLWELNLLAVPKEAHTNNESPMGIP